MVAKRKGGRAKLSSVVVTQVLLRIFGRPCSGRSLFYLTIEIDNQLLCAPLLTSRFFYDPNPTSPIPPINPPLTGLPSLSLPLAIGAFLALTIHPRL